jgi:hypothetical protein
MDAGAEPLAPFGMRLLAHIKKLDDCFGQFLVRVTCKCGAVREIKPEALARLVGWLMTLEELARLVGNTCVGTST